jgi:1,4-alpha-glucan branching enzyme
MPSSTTPEPDILTELAETVHATLPPDRYVHLILENERNQAKYLRRNSSCRPKTYTAQWDDDIHHVLHVLVTGEQDGYYSDYTDVTADRLGRCLTEGFAYQGDVSHYKHGAKRGESTQGVPLTAFVTFLQNHDQIGNRAFGDRIAKCSDPRAVRAAVAVLLLTPSPPLLFMGEEFGADTPFLFFSDFQGESGDRRNARPQKRICPLFLIQRSGEARTNPRSKRARNFPSVAARLGNHFAAATSGVARTLPPVAPTAPSAHHSAPRCSLQNRLKL